LENGVGCKSRRDIDHAGGGTRLASRLLDRVEHRQVEMRSAAFSRRHASDHLGAIGDRLLGVESALRAGESLADHLGFSIDEDRHHAASLTAFTTFSAASARLSAETIGSPDSSSIRLPRSTLVPSSLTTSGTSRRTSRAAATTPSAMMSQRM